MLHLSTSKRVAALKQSTPFDRKIFSTKTLAVRMRKMGSCVTDRETEILYAVASQFLKIGYPFRDEILIPKLASFHAIKIKSGT